MSSVMVLNVLVFMALCGRGLTFGIVVTEVQTSFSRPDPIAPKYIVALSHGKSDLSGSLGNLVAGGPSSDPGAQLTAAAARPLPASCPRVPMTAEDGRKLCCTVPSPECMTGSSLQQQAQDLIRSQFAAAADKTPAGLLEAMSAMCMYRQEGLWTYEVCYKKHTRQFRQDNTGRNEDFSCGAYMGDELQDDSIKEDTSSHPHPIRYVSHTFSGGAKCAMTGESRTAEVRFTCLPDVNDNFIVSIKEFPTCNYLFLVNALALCKHPEFQPPVQHESTIMCELAAPGGGCGPEGADGTKAPLAAEVV